MKTKATLALTLAAALGGALSVQAQWQTQSILIKPGWSAIYIHVDASYDTLDDLVGGDANNPIEEVWMWNPPQSSVQFVTSPQAPLTGNSQWANWERLNTGMGATSTLHSLVPNAAYLVRSTAAGNYTWTLKGKPMPPSYSWATTGENFIGFPTAPNSPPTFSTFLAQAPSLEAVAQIFQYQGGALSSTNPAQVFNLFGTSVNRGQAFWIRAGSYFNNYYGPFTVVPQDPAGVNFSNSVSQYSFHLQNPTANPVTVQMKLLNSETPPSGEPAIQDVPPLLIRGALVTSNLTYGYTNLTTGNSVSWTLPPSGQNGSDIQVIIGLNRYAMSGAPGTLYAGILQLTDATGLTEVDLPVSAQMASYAGLWIGQATVSQVRAYLKSFQTDGAGNPVVNTNSGAYIITSINTNLGPTAQSFPLRLIVHNDGTNVNLLERVFYGQDPGSNTIVTTSESFLDPTQLGSARRISAVHLPWTAANNPYPMSGSLAPGGLLTATVNTDYADQSSNPFLHTFHPDHDNLDATFQIQLPVGVESYDISRNITLNITPPSDDFQSLTQAGQSFTGAYSEALILTAIGGATKEFDTAGSFSLSQISPIAVLTH